MKFFNFFFLKFLILNLFLFHIFHQKMFLWNFLFFFLKFLIYNLFLISFIFIYLIFFFRADSSLLLPENCPPQRLSTQSQPSQPQQQHRLVLANRTNPLAQRRSKMPPSAGRVAATTTTANVHAERDRVGRRF